MTVKGKLSEEQHAMPFTRIATTAPDDFDTDVKWARVLWKAVAATPSVGTFAQVKPLKTAASKKWDEEAFLDDFIFTLDDRLRKLSDERNDPKILDMDREYCKGFYVYRFEEPPVYEFASTALNNQDARQRKGKANASVVLFNWKKWGYFSKQDHGEQKH